MDLIIGLILFVILAGLVVLFVTEPLTGRFHSKASDSQALSSLLAERDRILNILKELDFDASLGKIPAEVYSTQRASLVQQGAGLLRKIDQLAPTPEPVPAIQPAQSDPVEALLSARRAVLLAGAVKDEAKVESLLASRRKKRSGKAHIFCSHCGSPLASSDRFCPSCGTPVQ